MGNEILLVVMNDNTLYSLLMMKYESSENSFEKMKYDDDTKSIIQGAYDILSDTFEWENVTLKEIALLVNYAMMMIEESF